MRRATQTRISTSALLAANLLPLGGVLFFGWPLSRLLVLYWAETAVIGVFNIFRMLWIQPLAAIPLSVFFAFHFGIFMAVHGVFLSLFFLRPEGTATGPAPLALFDLVSWELLAFVASHGVSFVVYWILGNEGEGKDLTKQMLAPYGRIIVMHISILFGGFAVMVLDQPGWVLVLFVVLKTAADVRAHRREHRPSASAPGGATLGDFPGTRN